MLPFSNAESKFPSFCFCLPTHFVTVFSFLLSFRNRAHRLGLLPHLRSLADPAQLCPNCSAVASVVLRGVELMSFWASLVMGAVISLPRSSPSLNSWNVVGMLSVNVHDRSLSFFFKTVNFFAITWTFFSVLFVFLLFSARFYFSLQVGLGLSLFSFLQNVSSFFKNGSSQFRTV